MGENEGLLRRRRRRRSRARRRRKSSEREQDRGDDEGRNARQQSVAFRSPFDLSDNNDDANDDGEDDYYYREHENLNRWSSGHPSPLTARNAPRSLLVLRYAVISRLLIALFGILSSLVITEYDSSPNAYLDLPSASVHNFIPNYGTASPNIDAYQKPAEKTCGLIQYLYHNDPGTPCTPLQVTVDVVQTVTGPFLRWDAFYFLHIAEEGYVWEQEFAFFPLLPALMRLTAETVLAPASFLPLRERLLISGILLTNVSFVLAALALYRLTCRVFPDERMAFLSALCFCISPAGIFMSAIYTESPYALFTFIGLSMLLENRPWEAAFAWLLAGLTRANAVVYCGFFVWEFVFNAKVWKGRKWRLKYIFYRLLKAGSFSMIVLSGFALFQYYARQWFCSSRNQVPRPWCAAPWGTIYGFVQKEYWNNGFLNYYTIQQTPNFLLAMPMICFSAMGIYTYAESDWKRFLMAGLGDLTVVHNWWMRWIYYLHQKTGGRLVNQAQQPRSTYTHPFYTASSQLLPHIYLWLILLFIATFCMHVQVITRFFSSLPILYWFAASLLLHEDAESGRRCGRKREERNAKIITGFAVFYAAIGVPLFAGFFPPA